MPVSGIKCKEEQNTRYDNSGRDRDNDRNSIVPVSVVKSVIVCIKRQGSR